MFNNIIKAAENFCIHQIRSEYTTNEELNKDRTLIAYIDIDANSGEKHRVYIIAEKAFVQKVSYIFLEEEESDDETLHDMLLETTNLIVGSAKVLAEESDESYNINTPFFEKDGNFDFEYDSLKSFIIDDSKLSIAIKEL
ncbi:chemotaxis protein CheX [Sulfurimonas sp.]|uniref:chemotaxis protein CheX n=1 Tax=Sulfurimonas sp. TaxID=2022749 RepID=UPI003564155B